jgi:hypothetical protein
MLGARAPRHVYAGSIVNLSKTLQKVTVSYTMPDGTTEVAHVSVPAHSTVAVEQRLVQQGLATLTGHVSALQVEGKNSIREPFRGVNSPVKQYKFEIGEDGSLVE